MIEIEAWWIPLFCSISIVLVYGAIQIGRRSQVVLDLKSNQSADEGCHFGSSNLDDLLKINADLLPGDVQQALSNGHQVRFDIGVIIGPIMHQPINKTRIKTLPGSI
jgi:hypothetical protein